jgi:hypothetical protein
VSWGVAGILAGHGWAWTVIAAGAVVLVGRGVATMMWNWPDLDALSRLDDSSEQESTLIC